MKPEKVRVGIIGVGTIGTVHANLIFNGEVNGMELCALCDSDKSRLGQLEKEFDGIPLFDRYDKLVDSGLCDAVIVSTPHYFHPEISLYSMEKGLNVLCEKPIGVYTNDLDKLFEVQKEKNTVFAVMFNQRTDKLFIEAKKLIDSGEIGKILKNVWIITNWYRTQEYYDSGEWRGSWQGEGGGVLMNQAPHNLDLWQWICGMPKRVLAVCNEGKYHNIEVEDDATVYAEYENGASGVFIASTGIEHGTNRFEITGEKGKIVLEKGKLTLEKGEEISVIEDEEYNGHKNILQNFANAVLYGEKLISPACEAVNQLKICNGAYMSSWTKNWVDLDFNPREYLKFLEGKISLSTFHEKKSEKNLFDKTYNKRWTTKW